MMRSRWHFILVLALWCVAAFACGDGGSSSDVECSGASCVCPSSGDCRIDCFGDCDLQCAGSGNCDFLCPDGCLASCTGSGVCLVAVGDESVVECPGAGGCDVACAGDCTVECAGSGTCLVQCEEGFLCDINQCSGSVQTCPDGISVCNGPCP